MTQEEGYPNEWDVVYNDSGSRDGTMTFYNVLKNYTKYLKYVIIMIVELNINY